MRNARCYRSGWINERVEKVAALEFWRCGADEKRVVKVVETTEKASRKDNLAKQP
ncbi:hypothetical protein [Alteromonas sp. P256]|uniref:hypothetical protein n=1 Tax=Alteromonas sp. P256 TaxID=3117399 RepID=UPI002FE09BC4